MSIALRIVFGRDTFESLARARVENESSERGVAARIEFKVSARLTLALSGTGGGGIALSAALLAILCKGVARLDRNLQGTFACVGVTDLLLHASDISGVSFRVARSLIFNPRRVHMLRASTIVPYI